MKHTILNILAFVPELLYRITAGIRHNFNRLVYLAYLRSRTDKTAIVPATTQLDGKVEAVKDTNIVLGDYCRLGKDVFFETEGNAQIKLGNNVRINTGCFIVAHSNIEIGNDCLIGEYSSIRDADHGVAKQALTRCQPHRAEAIVIEDNVWIGRGAVILKGVRIGVGSVVAANSVVTHNVAPHTIVAGSPARLIRDIS